MFNDCYTILKCEMELLINFNYIAAVTNWNLKKHIIPWSDVAIMTRVVDDKSSKTISIQLLKEGGKCFI